MYRAVLVAFDGSDRSLVALPHARRLAAAWHCPVELLHVGRDRVESTPSVGVPLHVLDGADPADALIAETRRTDPSELLCMSTRGRSAMGELLLGSVAGKVLHDLHAEIVLVGPAVAEIGDGRPLRQALVCLDGSAVSAAILPVARRWVAELGLAVTVLYVAYPLGDAAARSLTTPPEFDVAAAQLAEVQGDWSAQGITVRCDIVENTHVAAGILDTVAAKMADLVLMSTHGHTGLERVLMGSVTKAVLRGSPTPVVTLRPETLR